MASRGYKSGDLYQRHQQEKRLSCSLPSEPEGYEPVEESDSFSLEDLSPIDTLCEENEMERNINHGGESTQQHTEQSQTTKARKRKARPAKESTTKKAKTTKKFSWTTEKVEVLLKYIKEYKTTCDFRGMDFEADMACMYTDVRRCMAHDYACDFGPAQVTEPTTNIKDMNKEQYDAYTKANEAQKQLIKGGYQRIKEKVKALRQDYRNAVNRGTRSGSGRMVQEHYDLLTDIWGGSPATTSLCFGVDGESMDAENLEENGDSFQDSPDMADSLEGNK